MGEPVFRHGPVVPLFFNLILPSLPLAGVPFADGFFSLLDARGESPIAIDPLAASGYQSRGRESAVAQYPMVPIVVLVVVRRPLTDFNIGEADVDPFAVRRRDHRDLARLGIELVRAAGPVDDVEGGDQIDAFEGIGVKTHAQRMAVGKTEPLVDVEHRCADGFGQLDRGFETDGHARRVFSEQQRVVGGGEHFGSLLDGRGLGRNPRRHFDRKIRQGHLLLQLAFLQRRVVAHVDRSLGLAHHDRIGAGKGVRHAVNAAWLVVPFDEIAHDIALRESGMNPVDKRPAEFFVHRAGGADDKDRATVDIGVIDSHRRMQKPDHIMDDGQHRFAAGLGVSMSDLHSYLFVVAEQHRRLVFAVIDQRIVEPAKTGAGIECYVWEAVLLDQIDDDVPIASAGWIS